ncbi:MAG: hypothetical protein JOS17DRAFT_466839 [Linnemannia elongata]|nr:MAG: hypothetical protein JOS17DRAFT_466839 [Linnemannia elongata]
MCTSLAKSSNAGDAAAAGANQRMHASKDIDMVLTSKVSRLCCSRSSPTATILSLGKKPSLFPVQIDIQHSTRRRGNLSLSTTPFMRRGILSNHHTYTYQSSLYAPPIRYQERKYTQLPPAWPARPAPFRIRSTFKQTTFLRFSFVLLAVPCSFILYSSVSLARPDNIITPNSTRNSLYRCKRNKTTAL